MQRGVYGVSMQYCILHVLDTRAKHWSTGLQYLCKSWVLRIIVNNK